MTLKIGDEVPISCPNCGPNTKLIVRINTYGRLFLGCPNYNDDDAPGRPLASCHHTQPIPTDTYMRATGQPSLFPIEDE